MGGTHASTATAKLVVRELPGIGKEMCGGGQTAFLIFGVRFRCALSDLFFGFSQNPSLKRGLQGIRLRSHQAVGPKKRLRAGFAEKIFEKGPARASQNDGRAV